SRGSLLASFCCMWSYAPPSCVLSFFFSCYGAPWDLHSFPTRRSSDLYLLVRVSDGHVLGRVLRGVYQASDSEPCNLAPYTGIVEDRKSTRLNSSHVKISYAVFCLKKKNNTARSG